MNLVILGAGGYGRTVGDMARQSGKYEKIIFLDDNLDSVLAKGSLEAYSRYISENTEFYPAFGNNQGRLKWLTLLEKAGARILTLIHSSAYVSPEASIDSGCVILPKAGVNTGCQIHRGCIINCGAMVDHDCIVEEGVHVCLGAIVKAENRLPACMKVEAGQIIENRQYPICKEHLK